MKCAYCKTKATDRDALGLDVCSKHVSEADEYFEKRTGRKPNADTYEYCDEHSDQWQPGCRRCEECSQHHYKVSVKAFLQSPLSRWIVIPIQANDEQIPA